MKTNMNECVYTVALNSEVEKERIDTYLVPVLTDHSRSSIRNLIKKKCITVNDKVVTKGGHMLRDGDVITINFPQETSTHLRPQKMDLAIIDVQDDFVVINKPSGLVVHHAPNSPDDTTLVNGLLYHFKELQEFEDTERPGIVHRLDKNTSGLILIARNPQAQRVLSELFKERDGHKTYLAVVNGHSDSTGTIDFSIGRHPTVRHKMSHASYAGREALTRFESLVYYKSTSLVAAYPETGRTHQIRVHLAAIGHGILGDEMYGKRSPRIKRQALHAWKLSFTYKGKEYDYCVQVPDDFRKLLKRLVTEK